MFGCGAELSGSSQLAGMEQFDVQQDESKPNRQKVELAQLARSAYRASGNAEPSGGKDRNNSTALHYFRDTL